MCVYKSQQSTGQRLKSEQSESNFSEIVSMLLYHTKNYCDYQLGVPHQS